MCQNFRRSAVIESTIDLAASPHTTTFRERNVGVTQRWIQTARPILLSNFVRTKLFAGIGREVWAFFQKQYVFSTRGERRCGNATAWTRTDDEDLTTIVLVTHQRPSWSVAWGSEYNGRTTIAV